MAKPRQTKAGAWEVDVRSKLLPRRRSFTFDTEPEAQAFSDSVNRHLRAGVVPPELLEAVNEPSQRQIAATLGPILRGFANSGAPSASDQPLLALLIAEVGAVKLEGFNYPWAERWVRSMKTTANLAPGSIRKRVGALAKAIDWHLRNSTGALVGNPLRLLPDGYSVYSEKEAADVRALGLEAKEDQQRDRRLEPDAPHAPGEEARIVAALNGEKRPDRERPLRLADGDAMLLLFRLILGTGARLREAYTVRRGRVDLARRVVKLRQTKLWRGRVKFREVPLRPELHAQLADWLERQAAAGDVDADTPLFPFWDGTDDREVLKLVSRNLSSRFATLFAYARCDGLTEHDLRHEATCRWFEERDRHGRWLYRSEEIHRIMGWAPGSAMAQRYASFRAEDLAERLWPAAEPSELRRRA